MEFEKKFLIWENGGDYSTSKLWCIFENLSDLRERVNSEGMLIRQGYLPISIGKKLASDLKIVYNFEPVEARIRIISANNAKSYLFTIKGKGLEEREEINKELTDEHTIDKYWSKVITVLDKKRLSISSTDTSSELDFKLEVDVFSSIDLILVEVEVQKKDMLSHVPLFGKDVTKESKYYSENLAERLKTTIQ